MFKTGLFSSDPTEPCQVDGAGLKKVTVEALARGMQHSEQNPLAGLEGRAGLLQRLSAALNNQELFGVDARPGNMLGMFFHHRLDNISRLIVHIRLPPFSPDNTRIISSNRVNTHVMVRAYGWTSWYLATITDTNRWGLYWRCMEML